MRYAALDAAISSWADKHSLRLLYIVVLLGAKTEIPDKKPRSTSLWRRPILIAVALVLATATLYSPLHHHPYSGYDDGPYMSGNEHVKNGLHRGGYEDVSDEIALLCL